MKNYYSIFEIKETAKNLYAKPVYISEKGKIKSNNAQVPAYSLLFDSEEEAIRFADSYSILNRRIQKLNDCNLQMLSDAIENYSYTFKIFENGRQLMRA